MEESNSNANPVLDYASYYKAIELMNDAFKRCYGTLLDRVLAQHERKRILKVKHKGRLG